MIVLHAVARSLPDDLDTDGLLQHRGHGLVVLHEHAVGPPEVTRDAVLEHGRRIVRLAQRCSLLPMRYATTVDDLAALDAVLQENADAWTERLGQVEGRCELIVHVEAPGEDAPSSAAASGRDYLLGRVASRRRRTELVRSAAAQIAPWSCELRTLPDDRRIAALVPFGSVDAVRLAMSAWASRRPPVEAVVTGPWPPFSFCAPEPQP